MEWNGWGRERPYDGICGAGTRCRLKSPQPQPQPNPSTHLAGVTLRLAREALTTATATVAKPRRPHKFKSGSRAVALLHTELWQSHFAPTAPMGRRVLYRALRGVLSSTGGGRFSD